LNKLDAILFELIQIAIGTRKELTSQLTAEEWVNLRLEFKKQALLGIGYVGITRLPKHQTPPIQILAQWVHNAEKIRKRNVKHIEVIGVVDRTLREAGIEAIFMKGEVCGSRYQEPLYRTAGDVDFVVGEEEFAHTLDVLESIAEVDRTLVHEHHGMAHIADVTLEPHYKVHNYQNPKADKAMREMYREEKTLPSSLASTRLSTSKGRLFCRLSDEVRVRVFSPTFESVFLISHMVNHVYEEGLGLRQVVDYAYFLKTFVGGKDASVAIDWKRHEQMLERMGMQRAWRIFVCVCTDYLGVKLPEVFFEDFKIGRKHHLWAKRMVDDMMRVGNFGRGEYEFRHDSRWHELQNYWWVTKRAIRMGFLCPSEAMWWPLSKFTRFFGKKLHLVGA